MKTEHEFDITAVYKFGEARMIPESATLTQKRGKDIMTVVFSEVSEKVEKAAPKQPSPESVVERIMDFNLPLGNISESTVWWHCMKIMVGNNLEMQKYRAKLLPDIGIKLLENGDMAFQKRSKYIEGMVGKGYWHTLSRHTGVVEVSRRIYLNGKQRVCVVIGGLLEELS